MNIGKKDFFYVAIQFILFAAFVFPIADYRFIVPEFLWFSALFICISGLIICLIAVLQLNTNLSPFPSPKTKSSLISNGLYGIVRHPIYSGIILAALGYGVFSGSVWRIGIGCALWLLFIFKSKFEEQLLAEKFPEYHNYKKKTWRLFPGIPF